MIYIIITFALIMTIGVGVSITPRKYEWKKRKHMKAHLTIPLSFWDDYNHVYRQIQNMNADKIDRCDMLIDDLIYKYAELMDTKVFWEKIETVTMYFEMRKDLLLNK